MAEPPKPTDPDLRQVLVAGTVLAGRGGALPRNRLAADLACAGSMAQEGESVMTPLRCRRRPGRLRCRGRLVVRRDARTQAILWRCPCCRASGGVTGWEGTPSDVRDVSVAPPAGKRELVRLPAFDFDALGGTDGLPRDARALLLRGHLVGTAIQLQLSPADCDRLGAALARFASTVRSRKRANAAWMLQACVTGGPVRVRSGVERARDRFRHLFVAPPRTAELEGLLRVFDPQWVRLEIIRALLEGVLRAADEGLLRAILAQVSLDDFSLEALRTISAATGTDSARLASAALAQHGGLEQAPICPPRSDRRGPAKERRKRKQAARSRQRNRRR